MVHTLPQNLNEFETISVKLKHRLCYKNTVFNENVRPQKIIKFSNTYLKTVNFTKNIILTLALIDFPHSMILTSITHRTNRKKIPIQNQIKQIKICQFLLMKI